MGAFLLGQGVISQERLEEGLAHQRTHGGRLGQILAELQAAEDESCLEVQVRKELRLEEGIAMALAAQYGIPRLPLRDYLINHAVVALVPEALATRHCLMPVERMGSSMTVAMADPLDAEAVRTLEARTRSVIHVLISTPSEIKKAIELHYQQHRDLDSGALQQMDQWEARQLDRLRHLS